MVNLIKKGSLALHFSVQLCSGEQFVLQSLVFSAERWTSHRTPAYIVRWRWNAGQMQVALWQRFSGQSKHIKDVGDIQALGTSFESTMSKEDGSF